MESPFGHNSHKHHHHERNHEEEERERPHYPPYHQETHFPAAAPPPYYPGNEFAQSPPPPPFFQGNEFARPTPPSFHHTSGHNQEQGFLNYSSPPPPATQVTHVHHYSGHHVSHQVNQEPYQQGTDQIHNSSFRPHHHAHQGSSDGLSSKPAVKVFCKAEPNFSLTIREGKVILASTDPSDEFQHWYKDEKYSTRVKDEEGFPCFALVNKATKQAMKQSIGDTHPVQLVPYNPDVLDLSILWTQSKDFGDGFRTIRLVSNIRLNVDAFHGDKKSGGIHNGTTIVLWQWNQGDNQLWKVAPY